MRKVIVTIFFYPCFFWSTNLNGQDKAKAIEEIIIKWLSVPAGKTDESLKFQLENMLGKQTKRIFLKDSVASVLESKKIIKGLEILHGEQKCFYPSGTIIKSLKKFEYGRLHGIQLFFHQNGIKAGEYEVSYGDTLEWKEWDWNGKLKRERNQNKDGYSLTSYQNGIKVSISDYDKINKYLSGSAYEFYPDGTVKSEKIFSAGILNGPYKHNFPDGTPDTILNFKDSLRHGEALVYHKNGKIKEKMNYYFGHIHGTYISYYTNEKEELLINYVYGKKHGKEKTFFPNGSPILEITYENGVENGPFKTYHKNVKSVMESGNYVNGYKHGDVDFYSIDGKKVATVQYDYGKRVTESNY